MSPTPICNPSFSSTDSSTPSNIIEIPHGPSAVPTASGSRFGVRSHAELKRRIAEAGETRYVIEGLIPHQSLTLVVGDSGLGKSPLWYQGLMCISAGQAFLGRRVQRGKTLYMDYENGQNDVEGIASQIATFLGLAEAPEGLRLWNFNDTTERFGQRDYMLEDLIAEERPTLVVIDPLNALFPEIEKPGSTATESYQRLRKIMSDHQCSVIGVHHIKKPDSSTLPASLENSPVHEWFLQARGARALINGCDVRLGVDRSSKADLILRGFGRVRGEVGPIHLNRVYRDSEPIGYEHLTGAQLLDSAHQELYNNLPAEFTFTLAKQQYNKGDEATKTFLRKCESAGLLVQPRPRGPYRKVSEAAAPAPFAMAA